MTRTIWRRGTAIGFLTLLLALPGMSGAQPRDPGREPAGPMSFSGDGHTVYGDWHADVSLSESAWRQGLGLEIAATLVFSETHLAGLSAAGIRADKVCMLVTAERTFDADGWMRLPSDERMSTLLTPTGLAIEGGVQGAGTTRYGYAFKSPFDQFLSLPVGDAQQGRTAGTRQVTFAVRAPLPAELPPGLYRLRFDFGVLVGTRLYNFNGYTFAARPFSPEIGTSTYFYSPVIPASGHHVSGRVVNGSSIQPRFAWLLLSNYNSNGYRGVVADEDRQRFATSDRSLIPDDVILPMYDDYGNRVSYSLEPQFPADSIDPLQNIKWDWTTGELTVKVQGPDGRTTDLGVAKIVARTGNGPTTKNAAFTTWKPAAYGQYTVTATGWIADQQGQRYEGGGTFRFWIARRMTLATATFQGMPYPVGATYGRDIQFNPAFPADVQVTVSLSVGSDPATMRTLSYSGRASAAGIFGAAQGMKSFPLDAPGEYHAKVLAKYTDSEGHLWVSTMRHAGIVYPESSPVVARGKKIQIGGKYVERGETRFEGYVEPDGTQHLAHITFPYQAGDVLLIGAEGQGANKIEPVLTYQLAGDTSPWDTRLNGVGTSNLAIKTSNGYSPHLYPEYITDIEYYYGAAPRPGFMGRFIVGESTVRAPYWPVSPNSFGGQIGASANGDAPGDIYRLLGGVVMRRARQAPMYSGYISSAFLLPKGTNNNRIVAAGAEDLHGPLGDKARFFLVGLRPGTSYEVGSSFRAAMQIDPILPVSIHFVLTYPDGRQQVADGVGDRFGSFAGAAAWPLDVPGIYRYQVTASWNGLVGRMPGLPDSGGEFFVYSKTRPSGATGLRIDGATTRVFSAAAGTTITGSSTASTVHYTLITPGAVIEQGDLAVKNGKFQYAFSPAAVHARVPLYDITNITTGAPQIGRVIHLTFFSQEGGPGGTFYDTARVILRGTTLVASRAPLPTSAVPLLPGATADSVGAGRGVASAETLRNQPAADSAASPNGPAGTRVAATSVDEVRDWDSRLNRLLRERQLVLTRQEADTVRPGRVHERMRQMYRGVPVFGAEFTRQVANGLPVSIFGVVHEGIDLDTTPNVGADDAAAIVEAQTGGRVGAGRPPTLVVLPLGSVGTEDRNRAGSFALAWQAEARSGSDVRLCFIDARTGALLLNYRNVKTVAGAQSSATDRARLRPIVALDLRGDARRTAAILEGAAAPALSDITAGDAASAAAAAHASMSATYDYYLQRFGRHGLDNRDSTITAIVNPARREDWAAVSATYPNFYGGAFWDGRVVVLGEGAPAVADFDGPRWENAAFALDVVAHELTHGVIDSTSGLIYRGESGALSEAFADILATGVEFSRQEPGFGTGRADYLIGEDAVPGGFRSMADPSMFGHPDHARTLATGAEDNGRVHANSTIVSHAFYLAVEGGTNRTSGLSVAGVGRERRDEIERAFYRAMVYLLPSAADFGLARAATEQSARDLYGAGSAAERAVAQAWTAVGVAAR
ncbi:MAG TPA: M4 family metallopeptidase [Vicinamibacterales bacterium]|jgi:Zn-dependent metalloprotease